MRYNHVLGKAVLVRLGGGIEKASEGVGVGQQPPWSRLEGCLTQGLGLERGEYR